MKPRAQRRRRERELQLQTRSQQTAQTRQYTNAAAAAAPPQPAAPTPTPPPDPSLLAQQAQADNTVRLSDAWATYQTGQVNSSYGFDAQGQIDPNNPYSRAALLQRSYQDSQRGTANSYNAAGQYSSGAFARMQGRNAENFDIGLDQLQKQRGQDLAGILKGQVDTYSQVGANLDPAKLDSLLKALGF
jgi:hypothetical protein